MRDGYVPADLETLVRRVDDAFVSFRTRLARARELPLPAIEPPDPEELRAAAQRPDAPDELTAVDRAVRDGRTTWSDLLSGRADHLPEVAELYRAGGQRLLEARPDEASEAGPAETRRPVPPAPADDWDGEPPQTFMRRGW